VFRRTSPRRGHRLLLHLRGGGAAVECVVVGVDEHRGEVATTYRMRRPASVRRSAGGSTGSCRERAGLGEPLSHQLVGTARLSWGSYRPQPADQTATASTASTTQSAPLRYLRNYARAAPRIGWAQRTRQEPGLDRAVRAQWMSAAHEVVERYSGSAASRPAQL
jgi:hypothetical protein